jgi:hypothetical protein
VSTGADVEGGRLWRRVGPLRAGLTAAGATVGTHVRAVLPRAVLSDIRQLPTLPTRG